MLLTFVTLWQFWAAFVCSFVFWLTIGLCIVWRLRKKIRRPQRKRPTSFEEIRFKQRVQELIASPSTSEDPEDNYDELIDLQKMQSKDPQNYYGKPISIDLQRIRSFRKDDNYYN